MGLSRASPIKSAFEPVRQIILKVGLWENPSHCRSRMWTSRSRRRFIDLGLGVASIAAPATRESKRDQRSFRAGPVTQHCNAWRVSVRRRARAGGVAEASRWVNLTDQGYCAHRLAEGRKPALLLKWGSQNLGDDPMAKELRTAEELSDIIVSSLGLRETEIQIRKDHAYGWQPTVVACPGDLIGYEAS